MTGGRLEGKVAIITGASTGLGPVMAIREVLKQSMIERRSGVILNFSSTAALAGMARKTHHVTAKASLRAFTKTVALEVGQYGIRCNCIIPGGIDSRTLAELGSPHGDRAKR